MPRGEPGHQVARLAPRDVRQVGHAVEVHEDHPTARASSAATRPPGSRCRRRGAPPPSRSSPPAARRGRAAGRSRRRPGRAAPRRARSAPDARGSPGAGRRASTWAPSSRLISTEDSGKVLKARRAVIRKDPKRAARDRLIHRGPQRLRGHAVRIARAKLATPNDAARAARAGAPGRVAAEVEHDAPGELDQTTGPRSSIARSRFCWSWRRKSGRLPRLRLIS